MITVNGKSMEWREGLTFPEIYEFLGYPGKSPKVLIKVNGEIVLRSKWRGYAIPDGSVIEVVDIHCGG